MAGGGNRVGGFVLPKMPARPSQDTDSLARYEKGNSVCPDSSHETGEIYVLCDYRDKAEKS